MEVIGKRRGTVSLEQIQELVSAFEQANFFALRDYIEQMVTDTASAITSITIDGQTKTVNHYYAHANAPQALFELETKIDEIANSKQWTGK